MSYDFALEPCEPDLDLIEAGRTGGREVFGKIIQNDVLLVGLSAGDYLFEDTDEF